MFLFSMVALPLVSCDHRKTIEVPASKGGGGGVHVFIGVLIMFESLIL